jgi:hypothetical protein
MHISPRIKIIILACIPVLALPAITAASSGPSSSSPKPGSPWSGKARPQITSLWEAVYKLGTTEFTSAYGGQETFSSGKLIVYVAPRNRTAFITAVRGAAAQYPATEYSLTDVAHSWAQLNTLTDEIARQQPTWKARGIDLVRWGPDLGTNKVKAELRKYSASAERKLINTYGADLITVSHASTQLNRVFLDRYFDYAPFYGGDAIFINPQNPGVNCTDAFATIGNVHTYNHWFLTAGHCGIRNPWYTNFSSHYQLGPTSTDYFNGFGGNTSTDVQTIGPVNESPAVWGNSTQQYYPYTTFYAGNGQLITFDGATTGARFGNLVTNPGPFCEVVQGITDCNLGEAQGANGQVICQGGDSGGPVFQRTTLGQGTWIKAVGLISAGSPDGTVCDYTLIGSALSVSNTHLDTSLT